MDKVRSSQGEAVEMDDDAMLLRRFASGDRDALNQFVRRWESSMLRIAYRIVGQAADADEVRQTVLLRLVQNPTCLPQTGSTKAWIRRCVINESISWLRRRKRLRFVELHESHEATAAPAATASHENEETVERVRAVLEKMDPRDRALLALRFDEGLSLREIADALDTPHTTVHAQLKAAIRTVRMQLSLSSTRSSDG